MHRPSKAGDENKRSSRLASHGRNVSSAPTPSEAAAPLIDLVLGDTPLNAYYGQLIRGTTALGSEEERL
jgi:hypothetical protein